MQILIVKCSTVNWQKLMKNYIDDDCDEEDCGEDGIDDGHDDYGKWWYFELQYFKNLYEIFAFLLYSTCSTGSLVQKPIRPADNFSKELYVTLKTQLRYTVGACTLWMKIRQNYNETVSIIVSSCFDSYTKGFQDHIILQNMFHLTVQYCIYNIFLYQNFGNNWDIDKFRNTLGWSFIGWLMF